ncbi:MAG: hypothetical protein IT541_08825 [Hyphomicrobiales bacterium]|nr:hypothetical protein [Hyphomicrobiales bacterium]
MDWITITRALHLIAIVHWIGGLAMVTLVILPGIMRMPQERKLETFLAIEERFAGQAKVSVTVAGLTGLYMVHGLVAWERFLDPGYWWMHAMVLVWAIFTFTLFAAEPLFLHAKVARMAERDPAATFSLMLRVHRILLALATVTVGGAALGAHGILF